MNVIMALLPRELVLSVQGGHQTAVGGPAERERRLLQNNNLKIKVGQGVGKCSAGPHQSIPGSGYLHKWSASKNKRKSVHATNLDECQGP